MEETIEIAVNVRDNVDSGVEPSMFVQRPSSGKCQDISHILTRIFRDEYAKDTIDQDTVRNLTTSRSKKSGYHSQYVEKLQQIQKKWDDVMQDAKLIEKHLLEAYSSARENEGMQEKKASKACSNYKDLGLPSVESHLNGHLNGDLLRRFNLIVPSDFIKEDGQDHSSMKDDSTPRYARPTTSSMQRYRKTPIEDNYHSVENGDVISEEKLESNGCKVEHGGKETARASTRKMYANTTSDEKNIWRELMKPSQREIERSDLAKLQERADFLRNPRFAPPKAGKNIGTSGPDEHNGFSVKSNRCEHDVLEPIPNPVIFTDYQVGNAYEIILNLKNITSSSRQLRVIPPNSPYFSISHGKFPSSNGLLAPGMSCQYCIKFTPDSLADYDSTLKIEAQSSEPLFIPLQARRPPPQLTLSETFSCGHCLVGGKKTMEFSCTNVGGEGRFCIVPKEKWPGATWKDFLDGNGQIEVGSFAIKPSTFHLKPNENINILITFSPKAVRRCKEYVVFVCDNCNTKEFKIEGSGETAGVELLSVEGGLSEYLLSESRDSHAGCLVRFDEQNPGTIKSKELKIKNVTSVELEYDWKIDRPVHSNTKYESLFNGNNEKVGQLPCFEVIPSNGTLSPMGVSTFNIVFKPTELIEYHNVARLLLCNVPCSDSQDLSEASDLITIQIEMKGYTKPFDVRAYPEVLVLNGSIEINQPHELNLKICNYSPSSCKIRWQSIEDADCSLQIVPNVVQIGAMDEAECYVVCVGKRPGFVRRTLVGELPYSSAPIYCHFESNFAGSVMRFTDSILDFGLVRYTENQSRLVELKNFSSVETSWRVCEDHTNSLTIEPGYGTIGSFGSQVMLVKLQADMEIVLNDMIEIQVADGNHCYLETRAIIQRPEVRFLSSNLDVEDCFVDVPVVKTVTMQNLTLFTVQYKWIEVIGKDAKICSLEFRNRDGQLKPREQLQIELMLCAKKKVNINDLIAVCEVDGMQQPLLLSISAEVKGLKVDFSTPDVRGEHISTQANGELKLEFGYDVPISSRPKAVLILENRSAISAQFLLAVEHFSAARVPTPPEKREPGNRGYRKLLNTKRTINNESIGINSKTAVKEHSSAVLSDMKGAAFLPIPSQGRIGPFEQIMIEVVAYMDMWGEYNDFLLCEVVGLDILRIPIHLECVGCPLNFQISKEEQPILRFGSHISGGETCCRSLRINNTSPCDIRLDWQSYIIDNDDRQLLDLLVMIGNPFPLLDEDNKEVESDEDMVDPLIRVKLSPHDGVESSVPFTLEPKQLVVPAKGHAKATAKFIPMQSTRRTVHINGYGLGYMSLTNKDKFHDEQKYLRCDGMDVNPFSLNVTGSIQPARLIVEPEAERGFVFEAIASDLIDAESGYSIRKESFSTRGFVIINNSGTTIRCSINLRHPFELLSVDGANLPGSTLTRDLVIKQSANIKVKIGMRITHSLITELIEKTENKPLSPGNNLLENREAKKEIERPMELVFSNGSNQAYNLKGVIFLPLLALPSEILDFGTCLIGQERELHILLKNLGNSGCFWQASIDEDYPESSRAVFSISPLKGYLEDYSHHDSTSSQTIKVVFSARQSATYECQMAFADILGRHRVVLKLTGKGSHDQLSEKIVNILT